MIDVDLHIAKLEMKAGDVLVVQSETPISVETAQRIEAIVKERLPEGTNVIVVGPGLDFTVVSPPGDQHQ